MEHNPQTQNSKPRQDKAGKKQNDQKRAPKKPKKITETYLHNAGLYYLERFASSSENFRKVMMRKIHKSCYVHKDQDIDKCAAMVDALVIKFQNLELLNDQSYTRAKVTALRRAGKSRRYILANLTAKGLEPETINKELEHHERENTHKPEGDSEFNAALTFARKKKIGPYRRADKEANPEKELATLARAGFSYDMAKKILDYDVSNEEV